MNKPITKKDGLYKETLTWMSYRYAIGMTDYVGRKGYSELERYRQFMDIAFGSEEFRALVNAFCDFLKRKKIKDVITLKEDSPLKVVKESFEGKPTLPAYVTVDAEKFAGTFARLPERNELPKDINEAMIIEYYNRLL